MNNRKLKSGLVSFLLSAALGMACIPATYADDIDIYLQTPPDNPAKPLVVLTLDLNLDLTEVVCSNVLADPSTLSGSLVDNTACELLQQVAVLPVLEETLGLEIGSLLDLLVGDNSVVGGLVGLVGELAGVTLSTLSSTLEPIVGSDSVTGNVVELTRLDVVRLLLYRVVKQLVGVNLAVMVSHADTCEQADYDAVASRRLTTGCSNGGYFLLESTELLEENVDTTVDQLLARLDTLDISLAAAGLDTEPDVTVPLQAKEIYYELYRNLTGGEVYNAPLDADDGISAPAPIGTSYTSPLDPSTCQDVHVVNIFFTDPDPEGDPSDPATTVDDDSDADIRNDLPGVDLDGDGDLTFAEMATHLATDGFSYNGVLYKVKSKYLVNGVGTGGVGGTLNNLVNTAATFPLAINPLGVPFVTKENFQPVNVTSASFGGPQPVFNRSNLAEAGDSLYYGMFKPDADRKPVWRGNLKKLQLGPVDGDLSVVDAQGLLAVAPDGNIRPQALTFWTDASELPETVEGEVEGRDGKSTDLGGAGMFLIPPRTEPTELNPANAGTGSNIGSAGPRVFYQTSTGAGALSIAPFELNGTTTTDANPALAGDRLDAARLIAFGRGYETDPNELGEDGFAGFLFFLRDAVSGLTALIFNILDSLGGFLGCVVFGSCPSAEEPPPRDWLMGDILHSHPLAIDYGNDNVRIFAGTNLGFMHQFRDQAATGESFSFAGQEVWRMAPRAMLANFDEWESGEPTAASRPYGVDGAPVAWIQDIDGTIDTSQNDHVYLYFGLRRGGKGYYALDVTNPDAAPVGKWHISNTQADFTELGLTFSTPRLGRIRLLNDSNEFEAKTVLIFGGGYDGGYNSSGVAQGKDAAAGSDNVVGTNDDEGNAIFVVDAETGELIWKARNGATAGTATANGKTIWQHPDFDDGIASELSVLDTSGDGFIDRLYVGDTGGRVWRADIGSGDTADWKAAPIANLGRHGTSDVSNDRRFFERPDVIKVSKGTNIFYAIVVGSGNRADPLNRATENYLYVIKDTGNVDPDATAIVQADLNDFSGNCASGGSCFSLLDASNVASGWRILLGTAGGTDRDGEKALSSPLTIDGTILFTSYVPPSLDVNSCTPQEGSGRLYAVDLFDATGTLALFAQDGEPADGATLDYSRGTPMASAGIPAGVQYIREQTFLGSDFGLTSVEHRTSIRTYWRERDGEY